MVQGVQLKDDPANKLYTPAHTLYIKNVHYTGRLLNRRTIRHIANEIVTAYGLMITRSAVICRAWARVKRDFLYFGNWQYTSGKQIGL